jgi:GT2 family glycosyltransferase
VVHAWEEKDAFPVRYVFERELGLSAARNRALVEANGEWIWYVDDDVFFSPEWLVGALDGIHLFQSASVLAGRVVPAFDKGKPDWLPSSLLPYYGLTAFGDEPRWLASTEYPVGANAAFRRSVFAEVGLFDKNLGRRKDLLRSSEETDVVTRLYQHGHKVAYVPAAEVIHRVTESRATMAWLRRRAYWGGISFVLTGDAPTDPSRFQLVRRALRTIRDVIETAWKNGLGIEKQIDYTWQLGTARQYLIEAGRGPRPNRSRAARGEGA